MNKTKQIQIFKPGKHTAMSGAALSFSESDLIATAKAYDPKLHEAPLVIGHPKVDSPRYGGVASVAYGSGILDASPKDVVPEFAEWVNKKLFNTVSASFYAPDSPNNPVPGVYYLRHVGFLGAQPPAIKGLNQDGISFAAEEVGIVEFADWDDVQNASLWRKLREWLIGEKGLEVADQVIPGYAVSQLEVSAQQEDDDTTAPSQFSEPQPQGDIMSAEDKAELEKLRAENELFKKNQIAFAEAEKKRKADALHTENVSFAEGLVKEGKLLPVDKDLTVATLDFMSAQEQVLEFGEGDAKKSLLDAHKAKLLASPKLVEFAEVGADKDKGAAAAAAEINAPHGYQADQDRMEVHTKALSYAEQHKVDYVTAVKAVEKS